MCKHIWEVASMGTYKMCVKCKAVKPTNRRHALQEEAADDDANREMGLPEGTDWGNK